MDGVGAFRELAETSSGVNTIIRDEFTVPFGRTLPPYKQADNHREADSQLAFRSLAQISLFIYPPQAWMCLYRVGTSHVQFESLEIKCLTMRKSC